MCGIAGFIDFKNLSHRDYLDKMLHTLSHRGPDGDGLNFFQSDDFQIGLGHKRLSIIDLHTSAGQPMSYLDWKIVFNGEIYNFQEIKDELIQLNHAFVTNSDTEVILHAFDQWGAECIHRFIGMFAFVLYHRATKKVYIYRDRAGVKPLFYYWKDGLFLFSSE